MSKKSHSRTSSKAKQRKQQQQRQMMTYGMVGVVAVGVILLIISSGGGISPPPAVAQERLDLDPILGNPNAPVTIIEYSAYACHACREWHQRGIVDDILVDYAGQVRFIQRDLPIIAPAYDNMTAQIAQCTLDQGQDQFWLLHNALYTEVDFGATEEEVLRLAERIGADYDELKSCADAGTHRATVQYDENRGRELGLRATPSFLVNDQRLFNPNPDDLRAAVEAALNS